MADKHWVQGADLVNLMAGERVGDTPVTEEDWSALGTIGEKIFSSQDGITQSTSALMLQIGKDIIANARSYDMDAPKSIVKENREFATATRKISIEYDDVQESTSRDLQDGVNYPTNTYHDPKLSERFYTQKTTFMVDRPSIKLVQFKEAFRGPEAWGAFEAALRDMWRKQESFGTENLIKGLLGDRIAHNIATAPASPMVINVREAYNAETGNNVSKAEWRTNQDAMRYAFMIMDRTARKLKSRKKLYNVEGKDRFTPPEYLNFVLLDDVVSAANFYMYNGLNQFLTDKLTLPEYETISAWQGGGTTDDFLQSSKIHRKIKKLDGTDVTVEQDGIIGLMFDRDALMISPLELRGYTKFVENGEFINPFFYREMGMINALDENAVVFTIS